MFTKQDAKIIEEVLTKQIDPLSKRLIKVEEKVNRIPELEKKVDRVEKRLDSVENKVDKMNINITKVQKDLKLVIRSFDREYLQLRARLERVEEHLKLPRLFDY